MKRILYLMTLSLFTALSCENTGRKEASGDYPYQPVEFNRVRLTDDFWLPRLDTNRVVTLPYDFIKCEETGRIDNFAVAGGKKEGEFRGRRYDDSDVFKVMEGAAYSLQTYPDPELEAYMDSLIRLFAAAQEEDGYLYTCRTINPATLPPRAGEKRWSNLRDSHELYNIGHMYEAAVAHYRATGRKNFLDIALKSADHVCETFGPGEDQLHGVPGHQEIEIGLVKLYRLSGEQKYLDMARYFLDQRGNSENRELYSYGEDGSNRVYTQDHLPVTQQEEALGHAVRAAYMYSGMADVAALTGDPDYLNALEKLWNNVTGKKMYITGGIGSTYDGEAFGDNYELPNLTAYCETCAAIANMLWNQRLFLLHGDVRYIDVLERTLYNNFLAGVSVHGDKFFYPNPLESDGTHQRSPWFDCACCPTNVVRFMPSLPGYVYARDKDNIYVNLFIGSSAEVDMPFGKVVLEQETAYPQDGKLKIRVVEVPENSKFTLNIRIPGWARDEAVPTDLYRFMNESGDEAEIYINGEKAEFRLEKAYAKFHREWQAGDRVEVNFPMEARKIVAHDSVTENRGRMCIQRGPLVYAAEGADNEGEVRCILLEKDVQFKERYRQDISPGVISLAAKGRKLTPVSGQGDRERPAEITLIPYFAWAHRGANEMLVWFPFNKDAARFTGNNL